MIAFNLQSDINYKELDAFYLKCIISHSSNTKHKMDILVRVDW